MPVSVPVGNVPSAERSLRAGIIPLGEPLAAQFTLTLLLLQHLEGDGSKFRSAGKDAVGIEFGFVHTVKVGWIERKVNRLGTVPRPSHSVEEIRHCFLILLKGSEAISEPSGNLARFRLCFWKVATFGQDVGLVRVVCFVHTSMMAQIPEFGRSR